MARALILYSLVALILVGPALFTHTVLLPGNLLGLFSPWGVSIDSKGHNTILSDVLQQFYPYYSFLKTEVLRGNFPLWNPYVLNGTPFAASGITAAFSPVQWLVLAFPTEASYEWAAAVKLLLAGIGIYLYCRRMGLTAGSAMVGGAIYLLCGYNISLLLFANTAVSALFGFGLWSLESYLQEKKRRQLALFAVIGCAAYLGGHPELAVLHQIAYCLYALVRLGISRQLVNVLGASTFAAGLAAVQVVPFAEFVLRSASLGQRTFEGGNPYFFPIRNLPSILLPYYHGHPVGWSGGVSFEHHADLGFLGIVPLALLFIGINARRPYLAVLLLNLGSLTLFFGIYPFFDLFTSLPLLKQANYLHAAQILHATGAVLAAWGVEALARGNVSPRLRWTTVGAGILVLLVAMVFQYQQVAENGFFFMAGKSSVPILSLLNLFSLAALAILFRFPGKAASAVLGIVLVNGICFATGYNTRVDPSVTFERRIEVLDQMKARPHERVAPLGIGTLLPNFGMSLQIRDFRGYEVVIAPRTISAYAHLMTNLNPPNCLEHLGEHQLTMLRKMGCSLILSNEPLAFGHRIETGWPFLYRLEDADRVTIARSVRKVGSPEEALKHLVESQDARAIAVENHGGANIPVGFEGNYRYRWLRDSSDEVEVQVEASAPGLLVLRDSYADGWRCDVDGRPTAIYRADYLFRAVPIPAGTHKVEFRYEPASFRWGLWISIFSWILLASFLLVQPNT